MPEKTMPDLDRAIACSQDWLTDNIPVTRAKSMNIAKAMGDAMIHDIGCTADNIDDPSLLRSAYERACDIAKSECGKRLSAILENAADDKNAIFRKALSKAWIKESMDCLGLGAIDDILGIMFAAGLISATEYAGD